VFILHKNYKKRGRERKRKGGLLPLPEIISLMTQKLTLEAASTST
jgi:hypothetical protein